MLVNHRQRTIRCVHHAEKNTFGDKECLTFFLRKP